MGHTRIFVALAAAAALFGASVSGCNRNREPEFANAAQGRGRQARMPAEIDQAVSVRPAEVLSASAHRRSQLRPARRQNERRQQQYAQRIYVDSRELAQYEPLPEPMPMNAYSSRPQEYQLQSGPGYSPARAAAPVYNNTYVPARQYPQQYAQASSAPAQGGFISEPYTLVPSRTRPGFFDKVYEGREGRGGRPVQVVHPSPELTVARAQLQGSAPLGRPAPVVDVPLPTPESFPVPIPELEPARYSRAVPPPAYQAAPIAAAPSVPATPAMAAPPLPSVTPVMRDWVASPATAMRIFNTP